VILDGGWVFDESTLEEILGITGIDDIRDDYRITLLKSYDSTKLLWRPPAKMLQVLQTADKFTEMLGFSGYIWIENRHKAPDYAHEIARNL